MSSQKICKDVIPDLFDGQNQCGLKAFYTLHVWAWKDNPNGAFVDRKHAVDEDGVLPPERRQERFSRTRLASKPACTRLSRASR